MQNFNLVQRKWFENLKKVAVAPFPNRFRLYHPNLHRINIFDTSKNSLKTGEIGL